MSERTACALAPSRPDPSYCSRWDVLVGLDGFHVLAVDEGASERGPCLRVVVEPAPVRRLAAGVGCSHKATAPLRSTRSAAESSSRPVATAAAKGDPLYGIRMILRSGREKLTDRQRARLDNAIAADERHDEVYVAWQCAQQLRDACKCQNLAAGGQIAERVLASFPSCPIPEIRRLGRTLTQWRAAFLAYSDTGRASNGGTEAVNGLIELHRRIARGGGAGLPKCRKRDGFGRSCKNRQRLLPGLPSARYGEASCTIGGGRRAFS